MNYFKNFPKVEFDFLKNGQIQSIVDIHKSTRAIKYYLDEITEYQSYQIKDGERPEIVSLKLYDSPDYYWTFYVINDFLSDGHRTWPLSLEQLEQYKIDTFKGQTIVTRPVINTDVDGNIVSYSDNINANSPTDLTSFQVGELVGDTLPQPNIEGQIKSINVDMNQLVIEPIGSSGAFPQSGLITSRTSNKTIRAYRTYDTIKAPFYYYGTNDLKKRPASNPEFFGVDDGVDNIANMPYVSNELFVELQNDSHSSIRVISPEFIEQFSVEYFRLINEN